MSEQKLANWCSYTQSHRGIKAMLDMAQSEMPITIDRFDQQPLHLNVNNGMIYLPTGDLIPHNPEFYHSKLVPVDFDSQANCPIFMQFMDRIFDGNDAIIKYMQRVMGYSLSGLVREHCLFILYGTGRNGKTTWQTILSDLTGDYHAKAEMRSFLNLGKNTGPREDLARLKSVRVVSASEIGEEEKLNVPLIKEITGGEPITARFLYQKTQTEFLPEFKVFLAVNNKPDVAEVDEGIWSRIRLIPFEVTIPKEERDKDLIQKLRTELPGILNWALEGFEEYHKNGLQEPEEVLAATSQYRAEMNITHQFLHECCIIDKTDAPATSKELYSAFEDWCGNDGIEPMSKTIFGRQLGKMGHLSKRIRKDGKHVTAYKEIELIIEAGENNPIW